MQNLTFTGQMKTRNFEETTNDRPNKFMKMVSRDYENNKGTRVA